MSFTSFKALRFLTAAALVVSGVALVASANASPELQLVDNTGGLRTGGAFPAVPTNAPDPSLQIGTTEPGVGNIPLGTPGWAASYLKLVDSANVGGQDAVTFTLLGDGDSIYANQFSFTDYLGVTTTWTLGTTLIGTTKTVMMNTNNYLDFVYTNGAASPQCAGNNSGGACPNRYDPLHANWAGFGLGGSDHSVGSDLTLGLSDAGAFQNDCGGVSGDCDYQDMNIGIQVAASSVPEPGSVFLVAIGLLGLGWALRRKSGETPVLPA